MKLTDPIVRWLRPPSFPEARRAKSAKILHVAMLANLASVLIALLAANGANTLAVPFLIVYFAVGCLGLVLVHRGQVRQAGIAYCFVVFVCVAAGDLLLAHPQATIVASFLNVMLLAGFAIGEWAALGFGLAAMVWVGTTLWLRSLGKLPDPAEPPTPSEVLAQTALPVLYTAILAAFGFRGLRRASERAEASEQEQSWMASRQQTLAELGERILRIESKPVFASQVAADLQRITGASGVAIYAPGSSSLDRIAAVGAEAPKLLTRSLPSSERVPSGPVHLLSPREVGVESPGCIAWTGERGYAAVAVLLTLERTLPGHDQVLLAGCTALLAAALSRLDAEEQLRHSQKMETVGQLTGVVAHDFNNLLVSIIAGSELVLHSVQDPELRDILGDVVRAGEHAALLTKRLMSFSRRDVLDFQLIDLREFALSSSRLLKRLLEPHVELSMPNPGPPVWVRVDQSSVEQIILNLVLNARDATYGSGKVAIRVDSDLQARAAMLRVIDNGVGMDEAVQARIFDPFFTTKASGKGTGLGLSAVRSAADALGGRIEVSSALGRGSEFRVILPLAEAEAVSADEARHELARARFHESVLLVDDHDIVRRTLAKILKQAGFDVLVAKDGVEALQMLASGPTPTAIVSDVLMPRMSGIELARAVSEGYSRVPIVLLTGYAELHGDEAAMLPATIPILRKPTTAGALTAAVRSAIDRSQSEPPAVSDSAAVSNGLSG